MQNMYLLPHAKEKKPAKIKTVLNAAIFFSAAHELLQKIGSYPLDHFA
jgi:hypothetical protein